MKVLNSRDLNYSQPRLWVNSNLVNCICSESKPVQDYRRKPSDKCFCKLRMFPSQHLPAES